MGEQNKTLNKKELKSGERQVQETLDKIEKHHRWRYNEALKYIKTNDRVLDLGMGCGYGSYILSSKAKEVIGVDDSKEAVNYAQRYWKKNNIKYYCDDVFNIKGDFDVTVAFEIIEHIRDTKNIFKKLSKVTKNILILSVPHISRPVKHKFHWRHFAPKEIIKYLTDTGFKIERIDTIKVRNGLDVFCVAKKQLEENKRR